MPIVLPTAEVERLHDGERVRVAGWPVARQHPKGRNGTVFVTIEDEIGDMQIIVWQDLFAQAGQGSWAARWWKSWAGCPGGTGPLT